MKKIWKCIVYLLKIWMLYAAICLIIPPLFHKSAVKEITSPYPAPDRMSQERVLSIDNNMDALLWRLRLIEAAQERVVLTTFDFRDDNSGQDIMAALLHAADRGVEVQILIDGMNGSLWLRGSRNFQELAAHECVEVKFYNPINLLKPWKLNYRMHDKYLIADDFAYILGGRNTDDLFLGNYADSYNEDRDILVYETIPGEGSSYVQLQEYFEQIWNLPCCKPYKLYGNGRGNLEEHYQEIGDKYPDAFIEPEWGDITVETNGIELCTNPVEPENKEPVLWDRLVSEMKQENDILIQTPYIICSRNMYQDLTDISAAGSKVEIFINAVESGTNPFGCTDYLNQQRNVRKTGGYIYEYLGEQALHTTAGTIPLQSYYLYQQGMQVGSGMGIMILQYVFHKATVFLYAGFMVLLQGQWLKSAVPEFAKYIYPGLTICALIIIFLILLCTWTPVQQFLLWIIGKLPDTGKWNRRKAVWGSNLKILYAESKEMLRNRTCCRNAMILNFLKLFWLFMVPFLSMRALNINSMTFGKTQTLSAIMLLLIGVLPNVSGAGPAEFAFLFLFTPLIGRVSAFSALILYRVATFFFPFLLSISVFLKVRKNRTERFEKTKYE